MERQVISEKQDNLSSILEKIKSGKDIETQLKIFSLFWLTHPNYRKALISSLQLSQ